MRCGCSGVDAFSGKAANRRNPPFFLLWPVVVSFYKQKSSKFGCIFYCDLWCFFYCKGKPSHVIMKASKRQEVDCINKIKQRILNMIKYTLYIGCNDKDKKVQVIPSEGIRSIITQTCMAAGLDGFTLSEASGFYKHDDGALVIESTYRLEILFATDAMIREICSQLKKLLNQESIAVQVDKIESYLA